MLNRWRSLSPWFAGVAATNSTFFHRTTRRACPNYNRRWSIHLDRRNPAVLAYIYSAARPAQKTKTVALSFRAYGEFAGHLDDRKSSATSGKRISRGRTPRTGRTVTDSGVTMKGMYARRELALYLRRASESAPQLASTPIANNPVGAAKAVNRPRLQLRDDGSNAASIHVLDRVVRPQSAPARYRSENGKVIYRPNAQC